MARSELARKLARRFLDRAARGYETTGLMHEKYDARELEREGDVRGAGGEYSSQVSAGRWLRRRGVVERGKGRERTLSLANSTPGGLRMDQRCGAGAAARHGV
jgi:hypothetical protein